MAMGLYVISLSMLMMTWWLELISWLKSFSDALSVAQKIVDVLLFHHEIFECSLDFKSGKVSNPSVKSFKHRLISLEIRLFV